MNDLIRQLKKKFQVDNKLCTLYPHIYNNNLLNQIINFIKTYESNKTKKN